MEADESLHANFRNLGLDVDRHGVEPDRSGLKAGNLAVADARANAGEEAEGEMGHKGAVLELLQVGHEISGLLTRDCARG